MRAANKHYVREQAMEPVVLRTLGKWKLIRVGNAKSGVAAMVDVDDVAMLVEHKPIELPIVNQTLMEVKVKKFRPGLEQQMMTSFLFGRTLMQDYKAVVSSPVETLNQIDFWVSRMAVANRDGFDVGIINEQDNVITWFDQAETDDFDEWIHDNELDMDNPQQRFIIAK